MADFFSAQRRAILTGVVIGIAVLLFSWNRLAHRPPPPLLSPLGNGNLPAPTPNAQAYPYQVYGFAPYWNLQKTVVQPELTHFVYFSLPITPEGKLDGITTSGSSTSRTRWESARLASAAAQLQSHQRFAVTFTLFNAEAIEKLLESSSAQAEFQRSVRQLIATSSYPITAINVDIEYNGEATPELRQQYVQFLRQLHDLTSTANPPIELSISVFATAASRQLIWDLPALEPIVDKVVVMAYDFHRPSSPMAGPVAPMFGGKTEWSSDILGNLKLFLDIYPSRKILLGIPFYGYEWETLTDSPTSSAFPRTGSTASYTRVQQLISEQAILGLNTTKLNFAQKWNDDSLSPYLTFTQDDRMHVIHYDDQRSIGYKLDLVKDAHLGGIAIWALGYEADSRPLWDVIRDKLK